MADTKKCAHPGCTCNAQQGNQYCSDRCRDSHAQGGSTTSCRCGHADCANSVATSTSGSPTF